MDEDRRELLRSIPKMDEILSILDRRNVLESASRNIVLKICRAVLDEVRSSILANTLSDRGLLDPERLSAVIASRLDALKRNNLRQVVNATGILLHTNLGRAPLPEEAIENIINVSRGYSNLEYNLETGKRGVRYDHVTDVLRELTGAEDALVVNNNAAAVLLVLNTLSNGMESIVSRGELIEIGGEFRIPEIMKKSGAVLREVGTTNRTRLADYEKAIGENTALVMKVHPSNYRIMGFTEEAELSELVGLGRKMNIPVFNDLGSGCLIDLEQFGLMKEPTVQEIVKTGADIICFSGDKLLGGPQAGIIIGRSDLIGDIKSNPLNRALRIDKLTLAALESTLRIYLKPEDALKKLRGLQCLTESVEDVAKRARKLCSILRRLVLRDISLEIREGKSLSGGGALPLQEIPTVLIVLKSEKLKAEHIEKALRNAEIPVITRIMEDEVLMDLRTISESEYKIIEKAFREIS